VAATHSPHPMASLRRMLRTDSRFHVRMPFAAGAVRCAFVPLFPRGAAPAVTWMPRWPLFAVGMMPETARHEASPPLGRRAGRVRHTDAPAHSAGRARPPRGAVLRQVMLASLGVPQVLAPSVLLPLGVAPLAMLYSGRGPRDNGGTVSGKPAQATLRQSLTAGRTT